MPRRLHVRARAWAGRQTPRPAATIPPRPSQPSRRAQPSFLRPLPSFLRRQEPARPPATPPCIPPRPAIIPAPSPVIPAQAGTRAPSHYSTPHPTTPSHHSCTLLPSFLRRQEPARTHPTHSTPHPATPVATIPPRPSQPSRHARCNHPATPSRNHPAAPSRHSWALSRHSCAPSVIPAPNRHSCAGRNHPLQHPPLPQFIPPPFQGGG